MKSKDLRALPNIGKVLADKLILAEIDSPNKLFIEGSENAFIKLATIDDSPCFNMLCAIEGAIQGCRWHNLSASRKVELKDFYNSCMK